MYKLFGEGKELNSLQMADRAFVMFFITLILIRLAGMRAFGQKSAFDSIIVIMLGAILSRAVTGASAFVPTVFAGTVLSLIHRILGIITVNNESVGRIVKGRKKILFKNNNPVKENMQHCGVSLKDLQEEVRLILNEDSMENVKEIWIERSGKVSIIKKETIKK